ncbi:hypothetical protein BDR07DRAFT_1383242, partial [Suillus spraguei]
MAQTTADMVFMSAGGLSVLYLEWTFKCTALPATPMPQDLRSAQLQEEQIAHHFPGYKSKYIGILYGTSAVWPHLTVIPRGQKTYNVMADPVTNAPAHGYTFFTEHLTGFAPPNALIWEVADIEDHATDVPGNVLVVRHAWKNKHKFVDCISNDIKDINVIVK